MISFDRLIDNNCLGYYEKCDLIKVFITDKSENKNLNFFTLFEFKEASINNANIQFLTQELVVIDDNHSLGIIKAIQLKR